MPARKILVAEDSALLRNMYRMIFKQVEGCTLLQAEDGKKALDMLSSNPDVDVIILDINMPVISGLDFLEIIRNEELYKNIPVIIVSTEGKEDDINRGLALGADAYIIKPFKSADLHGLIEKVTSKANA